MKNCNNCKFAQYTCGQIGYAEQKKFSLAYFSRIYCYNPKTQGYKLKNFVCENFEVRL